MRLIPPEEAAKRARAARAYAGIDQKELAKRTGIKPGTLNNIMSDSRPTSGDYERLSLIADACGVPRSFMEHGFNGATKPSIEERVARLEDLLTEHGLLDVDGLEDPKAAATKRALAAGGRTKARAQLQEGRKDPPDPPSDTPGR